MIRPSNAAKKNYKTATTVLVVVIFIGGIALVLKPSFKWVKGQLLHMEETAHRASLKEQNQRNWCTDVLESDSISESDYADCEVFWKD